MGEDEKVKRQKESYNLNLMQIIKLNLYWLGV